MVYRIIEDGKDIVVSYIFTYMWLLHFLKSKTHSDGTQTGLMTVNILFISVNDGRHVVY